MDLPHRMFTGGVTTHFWRTWGWFMALGLPHDLPPIGEFFRASEPEWENE